MHQKVDRAPLLAQGLEHAIHRGNVFDIAGQHGFRADAVRQRGHPLVQALALIGKGQFGALIGSYQALKHPTVDAYVAYEQARSHLYSAAHCFGEQGVGEIATRMAKAQADAAMSFAADRAIQFHGGFGFTYDCDAQLYRRRAIWHASQYGDGAYHKQKLADLLL